MAPPPRPPLFPRTCAGAREPLLPRIFERQGLHALGLTALLIAWATLMRQEAYRVGSLGGLSTPAWATIAVSLAVAHQVWVWGVWRIELHTTWVSRRLGDRGFIGYAVVFAVLGLGRTAAVFVLARANATPLNLAGSLALKACALIALALTAWLFYSVHRYFGFRRALGSDHFEPDDRTRPPVRQGIFRYTPNGMYTFGFLLLWAPGLWLASPAALATAAFNHLYIWIHFLSTEQPDMRRIYASHPRKLSPSRPAPGVTPGITPKAPGIPPESFPPT